MNCIFMTTCKLCVSPCCIHCCTDYIEFSPHSPSHMLLAGTPQMCELPHLMFSPSLAVATFHSPGGEHYAKTYNHYIHINIVFITPTMMFISYVSLRFCEWILKWTLCGLYEPALSYSFSVNNIQEFALIQIAHCLLKLGSKLTVVQ